MTRVTKRTTYEVLHEGHLLEIDDEPYGDSLLVHVNGNVAIVGYLLVDPDAEDPIASDEGTALHGLEWRGPRHHPLDVDTVNTLARENPGRCFWVNKEEHGLVCYYRSGDAIAVVDAVHGAALYVAPEDAPDPARYCDNALEEYSAWVNGEVYGYWVCRYTRADGAWSKDGEPDTVWGLIGHAYATGELAAAVEEVK